MEARFETERVEAAVVGLGVGAFFECAGVGVAAARGYQLISWFCCCMYVLYT